MNTRFNFQSPCISVSSSLYRRTDLRVSFNPLSQQYLLIFIRPFHLHQCMSGSSKYLQFCGSLGATSFLLATGSRVEFIVCLRNLTCTQICNMGFLFTYNSSFLPNDYRNHFIFTSPQFTLHIVQFLQGQNLKLGINVREFQPQKQQYRCAQNWEKLFVLTYRYTPLCLQSVGTVCFQTRYKRDLQTKRMLLTCCNLTAFEYSTKTRSCIAQTRRYVIKKTRSLHSIRYKLNLR